MLTVGSLFSGIGGIDLGLEWTGGFRTIWFVENNKYCQQVLAKHWPGVPIHGDIKEVDFTSLPRPDLLCGGFPCQPFSVAGKRKGTADNRWLWPEFYRAICEIKPRWVLVENVPGLLSIDSGRVFRGILRDLAESGYDAEWQVLSAAQFGAPHLRFRVFLVAYTNGSGTREQSSIISGRESSPESRDKQCRNVFKSAGPDVVNPQQCGCSGKPRRRARSQFEDGYLQMEETADVSYSPQRQNIFGESGGMGETANGREGIDSTSGNGGADVADSEGDYIRAGLCQEEQRWQWGGRSGNIGCKISDSYQPGLSQSRVGRKKREPDEREGAAINRSDWWSTEPDVGRVAHGIPSRVDRLKSLGNAVVPACAEFIGKEY